MEKSISTESLESLVEELYREFENKVLPKLTEIHEETKRYLYFLSWLNKELEDRGRGRIVVTGGFAVEVYTGRIYRTMDVDIIVEGVNVTKIVESFLAKFSERIGRGYLPRYEVLQLKSIDIVSSVYGKKAQPTKLLIDSLHIYLEPVEELITTYLAGWKHWGATEDRDKALWLYIVWRDRLDEEHLNKRSKEEGVEDYLELLKKVTSSQEAGETKR